MNNKNQFDLNDLITEDDLVCVDRAAEKSRKWREEVEWHREHDPNFDEWYAEECRKIDERWNERCVQMTIAEFNEKHKHHRGL